MMLAAIALMLVRIAGTEPLAPSFSEAPLDFVAWAPQEQGVAPVQQVPAKPIEDLLGQLESAAGERLQELQREAFARFTDEVERYNGWNAQRLAEAMHRRAQASWSAMTLALVSTRLGDTARATRVLQDAIKSEKDPELQQELLERLGLAHLGGGNEAAARGPLGSSFQRGSVNAGVVLGSLELREGRMPQARAIFRTLLDEQPPPGWALRGWGLSMLPEPAPSQAPQGNPRTPVTPAF